MSARISVWILSRLVYYSSDALVMILTYSYIIIIIMMVDYNDS